MSKRSRPLHALLFVALASSCGGKTEVAQKPPPPPPPPPPTVSPIETTKPAEPPPPPPEAPSKWAKCEAAPVDMICIPGGNAVIGTDDGPDIEHPKHTVEVSTFYVDKYEVRNKEYEACEKAKVCPTRVPPDKTFLGANQPALPLEWQAANTYCRWAGKRMLTEAEWEKVARGGEEARVYPWGADAPTCQRGQFQGCAPDTTKDVGSFPAGPYGVFDMAGNGYEWVQDWSSACYSGCKEACGDACLGLDPLGPCGGAATCKGNKKRMLKGGSWYWPGNHGRGPHRRPTEPKSGMHRLSVRCASTSADLSTWPPLAISDPLPAPKALVAPSAAELATFRDLVEDTDVDKIPTCSKEGEATHTCKDPHSYVTTNEPNQQVYAPYIKNLGGGYAGVGSDQGYTFIAHAKSEWAWLFDYDPAVVRVHYILRAVILANPTREGFATAFQAANQKATAELIKKSLTETAFPGGKPPPASEVDATIKLFTVGRGALHDTYLKMVKAPVAEFGWLRSDDAYGHIRKLYEQGRVVAVKGNLLTNVAIPAISASAKKLGVAIRVYYTSNADDQWPLTKTYRENFLTLPFDARSVFIHTTLPQGGGKRKLGEWDYVVHAGKDAQRKFKAEGWDQMRTLNTEGVRRDPKYLITIALPAKTPREAPPPAPAN